ncbi:hypothetical protein IPH92_02625 [Candidatus Kaiserbacteria bacterium]|nr:MAG: hypothetical protein IPH92_02625 [Candidatus Kaiserbacteria bacterium]
MKKIITSVGMLVFAGALIVGGTGAFFSDTETSTGNVFTAGAIDLTVDSEAHYNGSICQLNLLTTNDLTDYTWQGGTEYPVGLPCTGTWEATDLGAQTFFNFRDVKPGDEGENTISLHIDSNPAWACVDVNITKNDDMTVNEPEDAEVLELDTQASEPDADMFDGELAQNIKFAAWLDQGATLGWQNSDENELNDDAGEGDNIWQGEIAEPLLFSNDSGPASDVLGGKSYPLAMPGLNNSTPMAPNQTNYIGLAWCAGTQAIVGNTITCDGSNLGNIVQTDSMEASIAFRVEQARNNPNFTCTPRVVVETGTVTLDKVVQFTQASVVGVDVNDFVLHLVGPGGDHILVDQVAFPNLTPGAYVVSEVYSNDPVGIQYNASFSGSCAEIDDIGTANMNVVSGVNPTCVITNLVVSNPN